jgi:hypothetical protein
MHQIRRLCSICREQMHGPSKLCTIYASLSLVDQFMHHYPLLVVLLLVDLSLRRKKFPGKQVHHFFNVPCQVAVASSFSGSSSEDNCSLLRHHQHFSPSSICWRLCHQLCQRLLPLSFRNSSVAPVYAQFTFFHLSQGSSNMYPPLRSVAPPES